MKVEIENFQSLKKVEIDVEKFTALIGRNNRGKSAVTRAVRSTVRNRGDFTKVGEKVSEVTLKVDGSTITRIKGGPGGNKYKINEKTYTSVGRAVPQEILDAGFRPIQLGDDKVYVQFPNQFEKIFLLNQNNTVIAETISKISKIDVVNKALRLVSKDRKRSESTLKFRKEDLEKTKSRLTNYERVDDLNTQAEEIYSLEQKIEQIESGLTRIETFILTLEEITDTIKILSKSVSASIPDTDQISVEFETFQELSKLANSLLNLTDQVECLSKVEKIEIPTFPKDLFDSFSFTQTCLEDVTQLEIRIELLKKISFLEIPETDSLVEKISEFTDLLSFEEGHNTVRDEIKRLEEDLKQVSQECSDLDKEISSIKETDSCPFKDMFECKENW